MSNDDYVIDENGAWGNPSSALIYYRAEVKTLKEEIKRLEAENEDMRAQLDELDLRPDS